jgi:hypothetical protein
MPDGLDDALEEALQLSHKLRVLDYQAGCHPLSALSDAFDVDLRSARSLAEDTRASGKALLLRGLDAASSIQWDTTLRAFMSGRNRTRYSALIILTIGPGEAPMLQACGAVIQPWQGVISRADAMLVALSALRHTRNHLRDRLAIEVAVALCGWDLAGVADEAERRARSGADLFTIPLGKATAADREKWEDGLCDLFDGVPFVKPAACHPLVLRHRVWRAQVAVLFGWLEEIRLAFVRGIAPALRVKEADLSNWEWSDIAHNLEGRITRNHQEFAERCRRVRNRLAHREPVSWEEFADLLHRTDELALHKDLNA